MFTIAKKILILMIFVLMTIAFCIDESGEDWIYSIPVTVDDGWETGSVEEVNISLGPLRSMMNDYHSFDHKVHCIIIVKNGKLVFEEYFPGYKFGSRSNNWRGEFVHFNWNTEHFLGSSTKSFVSALVGIAIDQGFIMDNQVNMFSYFPDYSQYLNPRKSKITIEHLVSMTAGLEWNDGVGNDTDLVKMQSSPDPIGYYLRRPMADEPGTVYSYNGGNPTVAGEIIKRASGMDIYEFSGEYLFHKINVTKFWWLYLQNDIVACSGDLYTTPRTMAKLGWLFLNKGIWKGQRIISEEWIEKSVAPFIKLPQPHNSTTPADYYGYSWWIYDYELDNGHKIHSYSARGWGGQMIIVLPALDTVVVFTQGYYISFYHKAEQLMERYILRAILRY